MVKRSNRAHGARYTRLTGEAHDEVYSVDTLRSRLLTEPDGKEIIKNFDKWDNLNQRIDFYDPITAEDIMNKGKTILAQGP
ncbi:MAG: hypothetical protein ACREU8_07000 [Gammaproteobacteria bacterium]